MAIQVGTSYSALLFVSTCLWVSIYGDFVLATVIWTVGLRMKRLAIAYELTKT